VTIVPWARIAIAVALLALLAWAVWAIRDSGKDAGLAAGEEARAALATQLANAKAQATTCAASLATVNAEAERGIREAESRAARGLRAAEEAIADAKRAESEAARARGALAAAKRVPVCRAQLEVPLCDDIPLL